MCFSSHALLEKEVKNNLSTPKNILRIRTQATSLNLLQALTNSGYEGTYDTKV
jgi:hypothetical protein